MRRLVRQGEGVFAIGNPSGAMQFSMTKGIVSAVGKFREAGAGTWIQTDTPINPGNSGGPLVNMHGEVVSLNTLKLIKKNATGIAFALSASDLLDVLHRWQHPFNNSTSRRLTQDSGERWKISRSAGKFNGARRGAAGTPGVEFPAAQ